MSKFNRYFSAEDMRGAIDMATAILLMREAFTMISGREAMVPVRTFMDIPENKGRVLFMPAFIPSLQVMGIKIVSVFPGNPAAYKIPSISGNLMMIDAGNGSLLGILDAEYVTSLRTGAASGLATDLLANKDSKVLAIFGTGGQALSQVIGVCSVRKIELVLVFGTTREKARFLADLIQQETDVLANPGNPTELKEADIICTATSSITPVFEHVHLKPGVHINAIGSFKPEMQEIPTDTIRNCTLVVDQTEAALSEAGDIIIPLSLGLITKEHIRAELGEIVDGRKKGRSSASEITVFKSVGNAVQDLVVGKYVCDQLTLGQ